MKKYLATSVLALFSFFLGSLSYACDLCGIYNTPESTASSSNAISFDVFEQYTRFNNVQRNGRVISNDLTGHQILNKSVTELVMAYHLTRRLSFGVQVPFLDNSYHRLEDDTRVSGSESGLGDISLLGTVSPVSESSSDGTFIWNISAGAKLATGDTERLSEEGRVHAFEGGDVQAIHGHDLALGSGSTDAIIGTGLSWESERRALRAAIGYILRTEGDFNYRYADSLLWEVSPGYYIVAVPGYSCLLSLSLSGDHKGKDEIDGATVQSSSLTSLFIGPGVTSSIGDRIRIKLNMDFPADINNDGLQAIPDWRFRGGLDISL